MNAIPGLSSGNLILILVSIIIGFLSCRWFVNRTRRAQLAKIPGPPTRWPLIGNMDLLVRKGMSINQSSLLAFDDLAKQFYGDGMFKLELGPEGTAVYLIRPDFVKIVLKSSVNIRKASFYKVVNDWVGEGLILADGDKWRRDRKFLNPLFYFKILESNIHVINQHSKILVEVLERDRLVNNVFKKMNLFTFDVICHFLMGINYRLQTNGDNQYSKNLCEVLEIFLRRALNPITKNIDFLYALTKAGREQSKRLKEMIEITKDVLINRKNELIKTKTDCGSYDTCNQQFTMIDLLLKSHLEDETSISMESIRHQLDIFLFAGQETTAVAKSFGLLAIANDEQVQEKVHEELDSVFGDDKYRDVTAEDLKTLPYLDCVIKEILRVYTPLPLIARNIVEDVTINGYVIPKGTDVWISLRGLHHDPKEFENPTQFNPDRFLPENSVDRHTFAYLPFSGGLRNCIGYKLALMEMKVAFANIFRRLRVKPITKLADVVYLFDLTLRTKEPIAVEFVPRS